MRRNNNEADEESESQNYETNEEENVEGPCDAFTHAFGTRRVFGLGFCGRLCDNDIDPSKKSEYQDLLNSIKQHRPYFTYWQVTWLFVLKLKLQF